jgi:hypothetical protein
VDIADQAAQTSELLLPTPNSPSKPARLSLPMFDATMPRLMERDDLANRPRGFRATFRTCAQVVTNAPLEVAESILRHMVEGDVARVYQRSDRLQKRHSLLKQRERYLSSPQPCLFMNGHRVYRYQCVRHLW